MSTNPFDPYLANPDRYSEPADKYRRCGRSGLLLPLVSLGLWHNFGDVDPLANQRALLRRAFDLGITHFDLANNYGPPPGSAETNFGRLFREDFRPHRAELLISTKAGYRMTPGPHGEWGARKTLLDSLDASLLRMGLDHVDIFYSHRFDPDTPLEETMGALDTAVRQGKALYVGLSNYRPPEATEAIRILRALGTPCLIHQPRYNLFDRWIETTGLLDLLVAEGVGSIAFCPLAQGLLTERYLDDGIPTDSRAARNVGFLLPEHITPAKIAQARALREIARRRGQTLAQMALVWVLRGARVTSALIGASRVAQLEENFAALRNPTFAPEELAEIEAACAP